ncbi:MAG: hydroxyacylglutathione hydrolase [Pseudomonadales bacterium]|nr:hydroxyacylglutathione hydrolase [Pseudomonadales bacterium]
MTVCIRPLPAFDDNYIWLLSAGAASAAVVVDPGDAAPVLRALTEESLTLHAILVTHHHADHTGGIAALKERFPGVRVIGPRSARIPSVQEAQFDGDTVEVLGLRFQVLTVPGHTLDHIAYYLPAGDACPNGALFCGDTLFSGGCGRMFEGNPDMMLSSLDKLQQLPGQTLVYCAHEYTQANLRFAATVEPGNPDLSVRIREVQTLRNSGKPSLPSNVELERRTNPFLRCHIGVVAQSVAQHTGQSIADRVTTFAGLRAWKDHF